MTADEVLYIDYVEAVDAKYLMNTQEAEEKLKNYLLYGIQAELFSAKEARAIATVIGKHSQRINSTRFASLFGWLQVVFSERETLCVAKIYDRPGRRYSVRSIPAILTLIEENAELWSLPGKDYLEELLPKTEYASFDENNNEQFCRDIVNFYKQTIPSIEKKDSCSLSSALDRVFQSRDKVHAHNEDILKTERTLPTWEDTKLLINYAEEFVKTIGLVFFEWMEVITQPEFASKQLEMIMGVANLVSEDYMRENNKSWLIDELRKELLEDN